MAAKIVAFEKDRPLRSASALAKVQEFWISGDYLPSPYAQDRMTQRNFDDQDIRRVVLFNGKVTGCRKVDGLWRYKVAGKSVDGRRMAAIFEFEGSLMTLVTVHGR